jgi:hypothetical protein
VRHNDSVTHGTQNEEAAMTNLVEQIEQMRLRMNELTSDEHRLLRSMSDTLADVDQKLLEAVRVIAAEHEARRGELLKELHTLASRMFMMPMPQVGPVAALEGTVQQAPASTAEPGARAGDWRQAAANIREELTVHLKKRAG